MKSVFSQILIKELQPLEGLISAVFIDWEGEAVDYFSKIGDESLIHSAHWGIIYNLTNMRWKQFHLGSPKEIIIQCETEQVIVRYVSEGYLLVLLLSPSAALGQAQLLMTHAVSSLLAEM